jgi:hypothetical protein
MVGDAGQHIGEPGAWIDVVEPGSDNERIHRCCSLPASIRAGEEPGFSAEGNATQRAFRRIICQADATIVEEACERVPSLEHIVHGLGDIGMTRKLAAFVTLSCPRFFWTPICPTGGRYGEVQYEQDQTT